MIATAVDLGAFIQFALALIAVFAQGHEASVLAWLGVIAALFRLVRIRSGGRGQSGPPPTSSRRSRPGDRYTMFGRERRR